MVGKLRAVVTVFDAARSASAILLQELANGALSALEIRSCGARSRLASRAILGGLGRTVSARAFCNKLTGIGALSALEISSSRAGYRLVCLAALFGLGRAGFANVVL